jgi:hypothetical protein
VEASITRRLEFPYETKGSGTPVKGARPKTANRFTIASTRTSEVSAAASSFA